MSMLSRRRFLGSTIVAGTAAFLGTSGSAHAEPPPETGTVRFARLFDSTCEAAKNVAADLLRAEGFTDVRYVDGEPGVDTGVLLARGDLDFDFNFPPTHITSIDAGMPIKVLTGMHSGCLELIANDTIHGVADLKGKKFGIDKWSGHPHVLVTIMAANVGLDPVHDIQWVEGGDVTPMQLFIDGRSTRSSAPRPSHSRCAPARWAARSSTPRSTVHGRNTTAACWRPGWTTSIATRWRPSA